ncbi:MAG TPA: DUF1343 domain-containing protein [Saprospiraceae bacterium]|nr:DUF1343 domain-containing protein [Saprospiraceae bacterium]
MKTLLLLFLLVFQINTCQQSNGITTQSTQIKTDINDSDIIVGAERIALYHPLLEGKKVACVVNHTSMVGKMHLVDTLLQLDVNIIRLFSPEHGFRGEADAGEKVSDNIDSKTQLPVISLYGNHKKPTTEDLKDVDIVLFDLQDVGVRFYTYISTLSYVMEACAERGIPLIVLDRPNPHMNYLDGPVLDPKISSFVGLHPVPVVYGMTIGEYATMVNEESWLKNEVKCELNIIPCKNLYRNSYYKIPISPSPNLPNMKSILLYPSLCFFEPTVVSVGRGTDHQFQQIGYPDYKNHGYSFTPMPNRGAKDPKYNGKMCYGEYLGDQTLGALNDAHQLNLNWLYQYYQNSELHEQFFTNPEFFDKLAGTDELRKQLLDGKSIDEIKRSWRAGLENFKPLRFKYLMYQIEDEE